MSEKSIDEMRAELEAAGYKFNFYFYYGNFEIFSPDEWKYKQELTQYATNTSKALEKALEAEAVTIAWAHYQREKQFQAMREFIEQVADARYPSLIWDIMTLEWVKEAKALLATLPGSD